MSQLKSREKLASYCPSSQSDTEVKYCIVFDVPSQHTKFNYLLVHRPQVCSS